MPVAPKTAYQFGGISLTKVIFRKYLEGEIPDEFMGILDEFMGIQMNSWESR